MKSAADFSVEKTDLRFGAVQGRLIQSPSRQLQWFPQEHWEAEFFLASALGIDYIELIAERKYNPSNPIWSEEGVARIKELVARLGLSSYTICDDHIIDHSLLQGGPKGLDHTLRLLDRAALLGCSKIILPLFEKSEMAFENVAEFIEPLRTIAEKAADSGIVVCLETMLKGSELVEALRRIERTNVRVVYDTGNRVAFGHDIPGDIRLLGGRIALVHIKDKNKANANVLLGTGLVDFLQIFEALAEIKYQGSYTFETNRGCDPVRTARFNVGFVNYFHAEAYSR